MECAFQKSFTMDNILLIKERSEITEREFESIVIRSFWYAVCKQSDDIIDKDSVDDCLRDLIKNKLDVNIGNHDVAEGEEERDTVTQLDSHLSSLSAQDDTASALIRDEDDDFSDIKKMKIDNESMHTWILGNDEDGDVSPRKKSVKAIRYLVDDVLDIFSKIKYEKVKEKEDKRKRQLFVEQEDNAIAVSDRKDNDREDDTRFLNKLKCFSEIFNSSEVLLKLLRGTDGNENDINRKIRVAKICMEIVSEYDVESNQSIEIILAVLVLGCDVDLQHLFFPGRNVLIKYYNPVERALIENVIYYQSIAKLAYIVFVRRDVSFIPKYGAKETITLFPTMISNLGTWCLITKPLLKLIQDPTTSRIGWSLTPKYPLPELVSRTHKQHFSDFVQKMLVEASSTREIKERVKIRNYCDWFINKMISQVSDRFDVCLSAIAESTLSSNLKAYVVDCLRKSLVFVMDKQYYEMIRNINQELLSSFVSSIKIDNIEKNQDILCAVAGFIRFQYLMNINLDESERNLALFDIGNLIELCKLRVENLTTQQNSEANEKEDIVRLRPELKQNGKELEVASNDVEVAESEVTDATASILKIHLIIHALEDAKSALMQSQKQVGE